MGSNNDFLLGIHMQSRLSGPGNRSARDLCVCSVRGENGLFCLFVCSVVLFYLWDYSGDFGGSWRKLDLRVGPKLLQGVDRAQRGRQDPLSSCLPARPGSKVIKRIAALDKLN